MCRFPPLPFRKTFTVNGAKNCGVLNQIRSASWHLHQHVPNYVILIIHLMKTGYDYIQCKPWFPHKPMFAPVFSPNAKTFIIGVNIRKEKRPGEKKCLLRMSSPSKFLSTWIWRKKIYTVHRTNLSFISSSVEVMGACKGYTMCTHNTKILQCYNWWGTSLERKIQSTKICNNIISH